MSEERKLYIDNDEIHSVVRGFEACTTSPSEFDHRAHVTVAFAYLHLFGLSIPDAAEKMRTGLFRFLDHHAPDRQKYNETITRFWIKLVRASLDRLDQSMPPTDLANEIVRACGDSQVLFSYYSKVRLASQEAKAGWVEPDLKALDF